MERGASTAAGGRLVQGRNPATYEQRVVQTCTELVACAPAPPPHPLSLPY